MYHDISIICNSWKCSLLNKRLSVRDTCITHLKLENILHILILPIEKSQSIQIFQKSIQFLTKLFAVWDNPTVLYMYYYVWGLNIIKYKFKIKHLTAYPLCFNSTYLRRWLKVTYVKLYKTGFNNGGVFSPSDSMHHKCMVTTVRIDSKSVKFLTRYRYLLHVLYPCI